MKIPLPSAPGVALRSGPVRPSTAWLGTWGPALPAAALLAGATWNLYLRHALSLDRVSPDLAGRAGLAATAAVLAVYALATTLQAGLFLSAVFQEPFWAGLLNSALWRIPTAASLG